ncbi:MAG: branched-chain amino acid ABC transporter permease [Hyphomicrobiaceae bacterium]
MTTATKTGLWVLAGIALVGWPMLTEDKFLHHVGVLILLTAIGAASLHLIIRTGHVSLCHAAFMAFGAYGSVLTVMRLNLPFPAGLLVGTAAAALLAAVIGPIVLRLTGKYFVLITFLFGEVVRMAIVENVALTGGSNGIFNVPPPAEIFLSNRAYYYLALGFAAFAIGLCARILTSELGRAMNAIRDGERLAECSGVPVIRFKVMVFVIACALAGMQGSLMAHYNKVLSPENFSGLISLNLVVMNVIGGMSSLWGALIGTVFMVMLPELLRGWVNLQQIFFGAILFATMAFMPGGIIEAARRISGLLRPRGPAEPAPLPRASAAE